MPAGRVAGKAGYSTNYYNGKSCKKNVNFKNFKTFTIYLCIQ